MSGASEFGRNGDGVDFARDRGVQLSLDDEDERLPWLESGDDEDDGQSADSGRFLGMAFIALIALLVIIGLIWWLSNRGANPDTVADGGTIAALCCSAVTLRLPERGVRRMYEGLTV